MNYMLKLKNSVITILLICLAGCSPKIVYQSAWQSKPVVADGIANEWKIPLRFYDPETKLNYTVSNDKENLYLCIRASDEGTQVKIMRAGMQLWIDTTIKDNKKMGIIFPMPRVGKNGGGEKNRDRSYSGSSGTGDVPNAESVHASFLAQATEMQITGFKPPIGGIIPLVNTYGIKIGMAWDSSDILIYEAIIPFKTFCSSLGDSTKTFALGIFLNALPSQGNSTGGHQDGGGHGGGGGMGGGGMHGGGERGGGYSSGGDDKSGLYDNQSFWINFHLANK